MDPGRIMMRNPILESLTDESIFETPAKTKYKPNKKPKKKYSSRKIIKPIQMFSIICILFVAVNFFYPNKANNNLST